MCFPSGLNLFPGRETQSWPYPLRTEHTSPFYSSNKTRFYIFVACSKEMHCNRIWNTLSANLQLDLVHHRPLHISSWVLHRPLWRKELLDQPTKKQKLLTRSSPSGSRVQWHSGVQTTPLAHVSAGVHINLLTLCPPTRCLQLITGIGVSILRAVLRKSFVLWLHFSIWPCYWQVTWSPIRSHDTL